MREKGTTTPPCSTYRFLSEDFFRDPTVLPDNKFGLDESAFSGVVGGGKFDQKILTSPINS